MELDADVFLQSNDAQYETFVGGLARGHGNFPREGEAVSVKLCLTLIAFSRWKPYQERWQRRGGDGAFVADFSQN